MKFKNWHAIVGAGAIFWLILAVGVKLFPGTQRSAGDLERQAQYQCRDFVQEHLHDPDSALFDDTSRFPVTHSGSNYVVTVTYRARNAFNATRSAKSLCGIRHSADGWSLLMLEQIR